MRWVAKHAPAPLRWLGRVFAPATESGFGFWWLMATLAVAVALGIVVALLLTPVAGLVALLVVAIWALVRWRRRKRDDGDNRASLAPARQQGRFGITNCKKTRFAGQWMGARLTPGPARTVPGKRRG
jgi:hypothetical protein